MATDQANHAALVPVRLGVDLSAAAPGLLQLARSFLKRCKIHAKVYRVERSRLDKWEFVITLKDRPFVAVVQGEGPKDWELVGLVTGWPVT